MIFYKDLNIAYLTNAKAGTSTILKTLWNAVDQKRGVVTLGANPRARETTPGRRIPDGLLIDTDPAEVMSANFFSVVRHPLVRLVSGYLNKIEEHKENKTWLLFCNRYNINPETNLSFVEFVDIILADEPHRVDKHFRSQSINIAYGYVPHQHIGQLEDLTATMDFLREKGVPSIETYRNHATGAADYLKDYYHDKSTLQKVVDFYESDFEYFNYAPNIENILPIGPIKPIKANTEPFRKVLEVAKKNTMKNQQKGVA